MKTSVDGGFYTLPRVRVQLQKLQVALVPIDPLPLIPVTIVSSVPFLFLEEKGGEEKAVGKDTVREARGNLHEFEFKNAQYRIECGV